jgi:hypothetical protein
MAFRHLHAKYILHANGYRGMFGEKKEKESLSG